MMNPSMNKIVVELELNNKKVRLVRQAPLNLKSQYSPIFPRKTLHHPIRNL
jgi:hypothetical protein